MRSGKSLAEEIKARTRPGDAVGQNGIHIEAIPLSTRQRTIVVGMLDELQFGRERIPNRAE